MELLLALVKWAAATNPMLSVFSNNKLSSIRVHLSACRESVIANEGS